MTTTTPAPQTVDERLRQAGTVLLERVTAATDGPWFAEHVESDDEPGCYDEIQVNAGPAAIQWEDRTTESGLTFRIGNRPSSWFSTDRIVVRDTYSEDQAECEKHAANADYIAMMHPGAGALVAQLLIREADELRALTMARVRDFGPERGPEFVRDADPLLVSIADLILGGAS